MHLPDRLLLLIAEWERDAEELAEEIPEGEVWAAAAERLRAVIDHDTPTADG